MYEVRDFKDPMIFDPSLTAKGISQVETDRGKVLALDERVQTPYHVMT